MHFKKDGSPRKRMTPYMIVDTNDFERRLKEKTAELGPRAARRLHEGTLLFEATLINERVSPDQPRGKPYWAYSPAQAIGWAGKKRGIVLSLGRFTAVPYSEWIGQCYSEIVTCLSRFPAAASSTVPERPRSAQLDFADAYESGFVEHNVALPDPEVGTPAFALVCPSVPPATSRTSLHAGYRRPRTAADNHSLALRFTPDHGPGQAPDR